MSFARPTLLEIITRVNADLVSRLELVGAVLRRALVRVFTRVIAGSEHMLHGHLEYLGRQLFPDLSDDAYLVRQASLYGLTKTAAGYAVGSILFTGTNGTPIPAGSILTNSAGDKYTVNVEVVITAGSIAGSVTSVLAGADFTVVAAQVLSFESPISGVDATATAVASTIDGSDEETTDALRVRLLERLAEPAHGGTAADYIAWSKEVPGVTRVWVTPFELGPGTVVVRFARDNDVSPIPSSGEVTALQVHLDAVKPAHATVTAHAPTDAPTAFTIAVTPDTTVVRAAVAAELADLYQRLGSPGETMLISRIRTAVGSAAGLTNYVLTAPAADVTHTTNQLPSVGTITWV